MFKATVTQGDGGTLSSTAFLLALGTPVGWVRERTCDFQAEKRRLEDVRLDAFISVTRMMM